MHKLKTPLLAVVVVVALSAAAAFIWTQRADTGDGSLRLYGNVDIREVQLAFRQPGRISEVLFDEGDAVTRGMLVARLDEQPYRDSLAAAEAAVQMASAELAKMHSGLRPQEITQAREALKRAQAVASNAEREYRRLRQLVNSGATSRSLFDAARAARDQAVASVDSAKAALSMANEGFRAEDIAAAEAQLAAAQAARAQAETALGDTRLLAPSDGTLIARVREPGSMAASQSTVFTLSLDQPVYVRAYVGEPELGRIAYGTRVRVSSDSSDRVYHGQIGFISPRAEFTPKTVETTDLRTDLVYRLRIVIDAADSDKGLLQGMPVTIEVDSH